MFSAIVLFERIDVNVGRDCNVILLYNKFLSSAKKNHRERVRISIDVELKHKDEGAFILDKPNWFSSDCYPTC